jgi:photosystem II stability/assembly factor-like uncharacterized protein
MFEANAGQADPRVQFISRGSGYTLSIMGNEAMLSLAGAEALAANRRSASLRMRLSDASRAPHVEAVDELPGKISYYKGNDPAKWLTSIPTYAKVAQRNVYPGVDIVYYGNASKLEYDFILAPGASPRRIQMEFDGQDSLHLEGGDLVLSIPGGEVRQQRPVAYQRIRGIKKQIAAKYEIKGKRRVGFRLGPYDHKLPLTIDPALAFSTFFGNGDGGCWAIALDSAGNIYVAGDTASADFPITPGSLNFSGAGGAFVSKLNPSGTELLYSALIAGSYCEAMALDGGGNAYITGVTYSQRFPTTPGAFLTSLPSSLGAGFVAKLNPTGSSLVYSTFLGGSSGPSGGSSYTLAQGIAVDAAGNAYVTGSTDSTDFPTTPGAFQTSTPTRMQYNKTAFVTKLNTAGSALVYSTYLGGSGGGNDIEYDGDIGTAIALDSSGNAYVTGVTGSADFPTTPGALQPNHSPPERAAPPVEGSDAFVTKLNAAGSALVYSTFLGGGMTDGGYGIAVDGAGDAFVTGTTASLDFPTTSAFQSKRGADRLLISSDAASTWVSVEVAGLSQTAAPSGDPVVDPENPSIIYTGMFDTARTHPGMFEPTAVFKSTDRGHSWSSSNNGLPSDGATGSIFIDPANSATLYAFNAGCFKSTDAGGSWHKIAADVFGPIVFDPKTPSVLYAGRPGGGIGKSTDGGATWTDINNGFDRSGVHGLAIDPQNTSNLYLAASKGIFKSIDGGGSWAATSARNLVVKSILIDPQNTSTVYGLTPFADVVVDSTSGRGNPRKRTAQSLALEGVLKTTDAGATWNPLNIGLLQEMNVRELGMDTKNPSTLYLSADEGLFKTTDGGNTWNDTYLSNMHINSWAVDPTSGTLYVFPAAYEVSDAFAAKLNPSGSALIYSTYLGGLKAEEASAIAVDSSGNAYIGGVTASRNFPLHGAYQAILRGEVNVFLAKLDASGTTLMYGTYLGGNYRDGVGGVALDSAGNVYMAGATGSPDFPIVNAIQPVLPKNPKSVTGYAFGPFIAKIDMSRDTPPSSNSPQVTGASVAGKRLFVYGRNFEDGAVIVLNQADLNTVNDSQNPTTTLMSKKGGKKIGPGDSVMIQVRNADGTMSNQYNFIRPAGG